MLDLVPGAAFGKFKILGKVGEGGMAEVYRAEYVDQRGDLQRVALKLIRPGSPPEVYQLFDFEADLMGLMHHPNLVERLEIGSVGGRRFLVLEDVFGGDLYDLIQAHTQQQEAVPTPVALAIIIQVLHGLAYFHQARSAAGELLNLVHADINPANIFVSVDGVAKLGDFGVAWAHSRAAAESGMPPGITMGKVHYFAPEQVDGHKPSCSTDLFAVGVILYELVMGYRPFHGKNLEETLEAVRECRVRVPSGAVDDELSACLRRALGRTPRERYASAGAMCGDLIRYQLDHGLQCAASLMREVVADKLGVIT